MLTQEPIKPELRKWTRDEYHRAAALGIFDPSERLELLEGEIVQKMSPQSNPHASGVTLAAHALRAAFGPCFHVREEKPMVLSDLSEPEPDVTVVRGTPRENQRHPTPGNTALVMEVSETSLASDRSTKAALYARHGVPEYWILNLRQRRLEIRRDPGLVGDGEYGYRYFQVVLEDGQATALEAPGQAIPVADMLPSPL